jgi:hypothetical protein
MCLLHVCVRRTPASHTAHGRARSHAVRASLEKDEREAWLARHARILALELWRTSDFVAPQEVWYGCEELIELYVEALRGRYGHLHGLQHGHRHRRGRTRPRDGLLTAVSKEWAVVVEVEIDFADVGDRCAMLLHVRRLAGGRELRSRDEL